MNEEKISLTSRKKWFWLGITIALLNPVFSGIILGIAFWTEPDLKKESRIILGISIVWGIIFVYLSRWLMSQGYLPSY
ncbi:MAG: hypothetical protein ISS02_02470 [Candidatus Portnoybacteria bacterium]|nr:hypothetical protein [Candidatus Portnoybacteria bacterium]